MTAMLRQSSVIAAKEAVRMIRASRTAKVQRRTSVWPSCARSPSRKAIKMATERAERSLRASVRASTVVNQTRERRKQRIRWR